jgi:hypothetical protein
MQLLIVDLMDSYVLEGCACVFLLARKTQLQKPDFLQKNPGNKENYKEALLSSGIVVFAENAAPAKPAAQPPKPWTGRLPFATRESTPLGA